MGPISTIPASIQDGSSVPQTVGMGKGRTWTETTYGLFLAASIDSLSISDCDVKAPSKKDSNHTHVHDMLQLRVDDIYIMPYFHLIGIVYIVGF